MFLSDTIPSLHVAIADAAVTIARDRRFRIQVGNDLEFSAVSGEFVAGHRGRNELRVSVRCPGSWGRHSSLELQAVQHRNMDTRWLIWGDAKFTFGENPEIPVPLQGRTYRFWVEPDLSGRKPDAPYRPFKYRVRKLTLEPKRRTV